MQNILTETSLQSQVAVIRELQETAGISNYQLARNVIPYRKLVRLALSALQTRAVIENQRYKGSTRHEIALWMKERNFAVPYGSLTGALVSLRHEGFVRSVRYPDRPYQYYFGS